MRVRPPALSAWANRWGVDRVCRHALDERRHLYPARLCLHRLEVKRQPPLRHLVTDVCDRYLPSDITYSRTHTFKPSFQVTLG